MSGTPSGSSSAIITVQTPSSIKLLHDPNKFNTLIPDFAVALSFIQRGITFATDAAVDMEEAEEKTDSLEAATQYLIDLENQLKVQKNVLESMRSRLARREPIPNLLDCYEKETAQKIQESQTIPFRYEQHPGYNEFRQKIWEVKNPGAPMPQTSNLDDDEIVVSTAKQSLLCPITTMLFEDPVTSLKCRHSFSKNAILAHLSSAGGQARCPEPGCDKLITESDLKLDKSLARKVAMYRAQPESDEDEYTNVD
ncbi:hypothetical protein G9A89_009089 [Geosiphon pyriformis]|nr:hypothetical protein G9A89_009089 [Geosiphon pyriformis]